MECINKMKIEFDAKSENEFLARSAVAAFVACLDPTIEELSEIKTAVSEAVSNSIIHGYTQEQTGAVSLSCFLYGDKSIKIIIEDDGIGIEDIEKARQPLFTTKPGEERSGMGFTVMESFMDKTEILSTPGSGTQIVMIKALDKNYID